MTAIGCVRGPPPTSRLAEPGLEVVRTLTAHRAIALRVGVLAGSRQTRVVAGSVSACWRGLAIATISVGDRDDFVGDRDDFVSDYVGLFPLNHAMRFPFRYKRATAFRVFRLDDRNALGKAAADIPGHLPATCYSCSLSIWRNPWRYSFKKNRTSVRAVWFSQAFGLNGEDDVPNGIPSILGLGALWFRTIASTSCQP